MRKYQTVKGIGWRDVSPIRSFASSYRSIRDEIYEIENCLRTMSLVEMRDTLREAVKRMDEALDEIGDDDIIVEKDN
jgi:hypothetical protein